jgi:hypothetical protein
MIHTHSADTDVAAAARLAQQLVSDTLQDLGNAETFDYGGHVLRTTDYDMCHVCTSSIAEAQQAHLALAKVAAEQQDEEVRAHVMIAASLFQKEAEIALVRAELHSGQSSEPILNSMLGFVYDRGIHDTYGHSHAGGER